MHAEINGRKTLFQVEIKNWSAQTSQKLSIDVSREQLRARKKERSGINFGMGDSSEIKARGRSFTQWLDQRGRKGGGSP